MEVRIFLERNVSVSFVSALAARIQTQEEIATCYLLLSELPYLQSMAVPWCYSTSLVNKRATALLYDPHFSVGSDGR